MRIKKTHLFVMAVILLVLGISENSNATMVPYDTYLAPNMSDIHTVLGGMMGVEHDADASWYQPVGFATFASGGDVLAGTPLWVIAADDKQVVGYVTVGLADGIYNFSGGYGIFGDETATQDSGASLGEQLIIAAFVGDQYYQGSFVSGPLTGGYSSLYSLTVPNNIEITGNVIPATVPEPTSITLFLISYIALNVVRKRKEV